MARIVSGFQTQGGEWDGGAILRGYKSGQEARLNEEQNRRANEGLELEQMRLQFSIQQALKEQMQAEAAGQEQAKAGKLQQFAMRAQSGQVQPGQKIVDRIIGARGRLKDPKALAMFDDSVSSLLKSQQQAKKRKAFDETLRMAEMDADVFPPEMVQGFRQQADAGGDLDSLIKQAGEHRLKTAAQQRVSAENEGLFSQAEAMIQAAPPGEGKKMAETLLYAARQPSQLQIEGKGSEVLQSIQEVLLPPKSKWGEQSLGYNDPQARKSAFTSFPEDAQIDLTDEQLRERMRFFDPSLPSPPKSYPARATPENVKSVVIGALKGGTLKSGADAEGIYNLLTEAGIPTTVATQKMVRDLLSQYTDSARLQAVEQRERR